MWITISYYEHTDTHNNKKLKRKNSIGERTAQNSVQCAIRGYQSILWMVMYCTIAPKIVHEARPKTTNLQASNTGTFDIIEDSTGWSVKHLLKWCYDIESDSVTMRKGEENRKLRATKNGMDRKWKREREKRNFSHFLDNFPKKNCFQFTMQYNMLYI